jgi:DNA-binding NtrC family response regulator
MTMTTPAPKPEPAARPPGRLARVLVIDDERLIRWSFKEKLEREGYEVATAASAEEGLAVIERERPDVVFLDVRLPGMSGLDALRRLREIDDTCVVIMMTAYASVDDAVLAMKQGAQDFIKKPFDLLEVEALLRKTAESARLRREVERLRWETGRNPLVGRSRPVRKLLELSASVQHSDTTILIEGESGSGKGLLARVIHDSSSRASGPLVEVNCTSIPHTLVESELMGHERGAFTDARTTKRGLLELADGGTLVLDEIGEIPLHVQVKLLRCLEDKRFRRVGGLRDLEVDVRVVAITNRDLKLAVAEGRFREDLYFRLKVFPLYLPPLRQRREDIPLLAAHFVEQMNARFSKALTGVSAAALQLMLAYDWPGNVRELRNLIERAVLLAHETEILPSHLGPELHAAHGADKQDGAGGGLALAPVEKKLIQEALAACDGNQVRAARMLHVSRDTLRYRMKKHGLM